MTDLHTAARMALEALAAMLDDDDHDAAKIEARAASAALRAALEAQQEPVAWMLPRDGDEAPTFREPGDLIDGKLVDAMGWTPLYAHPPAQSAKVEAQQEPVTAREVAQQVFALCEHIEGLPESPADSLALERFSAGQRFAAKQIRRGIGTWLTDEENVRGAAHPPAQPRLTVRVTSFPETNGRRNWTAMLMRVEPWRGLIGNCGGLTLARGELWNRVAYEAECARALLGERDTEPHILDYGDDIHTPEQWAGEVRGGRSMLAARPQPKETT